MSPVEMAVMGGVILIVGVLLYLSVGYQKRIANDTQRLQGVRTVQAALESFRGQRASYPVSIDNFPSVKEAGLTMVYVPTPEKCGEDKDVLCAGYTLSFQLEGAVGSLTGGKCQAGPQGVSCAK